MPGAKTKAFLSYNWIDRAVADQIDNFLTPRGIEVCRDTRMLRRGDDLKDFMRRIRCCSPCLLVVSDRYLKSPNCMYEVAQAAMDLDFRQKLRPLVLDSAEVFSPLGRAGYLRYWEERYEELERTIRAFPSMETARGLCGDLGEIRQIERVLPDFLALLSGRYCPTDIHTYLTSLEEELLVPA